jgi:YegS/Rv2252/BmrU family lipid kinase
LTPRPDRALVAIISGRGRYETRALVNALAWGLGREVDFRHVLVRSSSEATLAAREAASDADAVVAIGGDGTVADVATGIFGTDTALGIVPAGSTNITARSLGIPADLYQAIAALASPWRLRRIDVGRSSGRTFLHIAGAGFDAEIFKSANPEWKRRVGWPAYLPAAAAALRIAPSTMRVTMDDVTIETRSPLVLVANGGSAITPEFKLHDEIMVDDGWLDALVFTATTPAQIATTLAYLGSQRLELSPHVIWRRARAIRIEAEPPLAIELDGDPRGSTPRDFTVAPAALEVIVPGAES